MMKNFLNACETISPELEIITTLAIGDTTRAQILLKHHVDWDLILRLAMYHKIYPLAYKTLVNLDESLVPADILRFLQAKCRENSLQALSLAAETVRIVNQFEVRHIPLVVLKGAAIALYLYGDVAIRPSADIDILVWPDQIEAVDAILKSEGYSLVEPENDLGPRQIQLYTKTILRCHHLGYLNRRKGIHVEVHWTLGHDRQTFLPMPSNSDLKRINIGGNNIPILRDEYWLLYLIFHGASHGWSSLHWLVDVGKFMQRGNDWQNLELVANVLGMEIIFHQGLILANRIIGVPLPSQIRSKITSDRYAWRLASMAVKLCCSLFEDRTSGVIGKTGYLKRIYDLDVHLGLKNKFFYVFGLLSPTASDIQYVSLPENLYALYYIIRPFALCFRCLQWGERRR
jgi:hypothetical protein